MILARLFLVYGVPAIIVGLTLWLRGMLFPDAATGAPNEAAMLFFSAGLALALGLAFFFHVKTRRWPD